METHTEYAIKGTAGRHGKYQVVIRTIPGHETDRERNEQAVSDDREWQASIGLTSDAHLIERTVTISDYTPAASTACPYCGNPASAPLNCCPVCGDPATSTIPVRTGATLTASDEHAYRMEQADYDG